MTQHPEPILQVPARVESQPPTRGTVGQGRHSHCAHVDRRAEWLQEQHARDLVTLDRIERQLEEHAR